MIKQFATRQESEEFILEENKKRCEFFRHYKVDDAKKLGAGCSSFVFKCERTAKDVEDNKSSDLVVKVVETSDLAVLEAI